MFALALALASVALAQEAEEPWQRSGWGWGGLPAANYSSDEGFGAGVIGSIYKYDGETAPYRTSFSFLFFMTTKNVHYHRLDVDALGLANGKLRLETRTELNATRTINFCGFGMEVTCDPAVAEAEADALGLEAGDARDEFLRQYYKARTIRPNARVNARIRLNDDPDRKLELMAGWRGELLLPGDFSGPGPFPDSLYATAFPEGEKGFLSILQAGVMFDTRDNEPAPRKGAWLEGSVRGATRVWGSEWEHFGVNGIARGYVPIVPEGKLTLATRGIADVLVGEAPIFEIGRAAGSRPLDFLGGEYSGRGIRAARFLGKVKVLAQPELRWAFAEFDAGPTWELTLVGFADLGWVATDVAHLDELVRAPMVGEGGGLRVALNQNFIVRADVGVSKVEDWAPGIYLNINHIF